MTFCNQVRYRSALQAMLMQADVSAWEPEKPVDVIYSNAALHWLDAHDVVFPRLRSFLSPGGVLAVQVLPAALFF
jgi:trans-aconitate 2-methyltransferase